MGMVSAKQGGRKNNNLTPKGGRMKEKFKKNKKWKQRARARGLKSYLNCCCGSRRKTG